MKASRRADRHTVPKPELNLRQRAFIDAYMTDPTRNLVKSYLKAGYTGRANGQAAAYKLLHAPKVQAEIQRRTKLAADRADVSMQRVLEELAAVGFSEPEGSPTWPAKLSALEQLAKHLLLASGRPTERVAHQLEPEHRELLDEILGEDALPKGNGKANGHSDARN